MGSFSIEGFGKCEIFELYEKILAVRLESGYNGGGHSNQCRQVSDQQP